MSDLPARGRVEWRALLAIARVDHWAKNAFVLPGIVMAADTVPALDVTAVLVRSAAGLLAIGLVASSNYTLNEILDAPTDVFHPEKRMRPIPLGRVAVPAAYLQWLLLFAAGMVLGLAISVPFALVLLVLWSMACAYNVPPVRTKDRLYLDVLTEAVNNPLRMLAGWFLVTDATVAPASLLFAYWMVGCYFMALKRYAEIVAIGDRTRAGAYRRSLGIYTREQLLVATILFAAATMFAFGAFCMRHRVELILAFPLIAAVMAVYLQVALKPDSAAQYPERLHREPALMAAVVVASVALLVLLRLDLPSLHRALGLP